MKKVHIYSALIVSLLPIAASAQTNGTLQGFIIAIGVFINDVLIPLILAIAFLMFVINVIRFFIIGGASEEGQKNAKNLALYAIGAFVFILSFWGIINFLVRGIGFEEVPGNDIYLVPDYLRA